MAFLNNVVLSNVTADTLFSTPKSPLVPKFCMYYHKVTQILATDAKTDFRPYLTFLKHFFYINFDI